MLNFNPVRQFRVNRAKILHGSVRTKWQVKNFSTARKFVRYRVNEDSDALQKDSGNKVTVSGLSRMRVVTSMRRHFPGTAIGQALKFKLVIAGFKPLKSLIIHLKFWTTSRRSVQGFPFFLATKGNQGNGIRNLLEESVVKLQIHTEYETESRNRSCPRNVRATNVKNGSLTKIIQDWINFV